VLRGRWTISHKFFAVLAVLAPLIIAVAIAGVGALGSMKAEFDGVFADNIHTSQVSTSLGAAFARADEIALRLASATDKGERSRLFRTLDQSVVPAVDSGLLQLQSLHAGDPASERGKIERLADGWSRFVVLRDSGALNIERTVSGGPRGSDRSGASSSTPFRSPTAKRSPMACSNGRVSCIRQSRDRHHPEARRRRRPTGPLRGPSAVPRQDQRTKPS
jgi:hypothetical protein